MNKLLTIAAAASLLATAAFAQTTVTTTGTGHAAIQIEPQYRTKIKTYVTEKKVRPITTQGRLVVGAKIPNWKQCPRIGDRPSANTATFTPMTA